MGVRGGRGVMKLSRQERREDNKTMQREKE